MRARICIHRLDLFIDLIEHNLKATPLKSNIDEQRRQHIIKDLKILDTEPEQVFEDITYLASTVCRTPVSFLSLIDKDRLWFKSTRGIAIQEIYLDASICTHVAEEGRPIVVPDTMNDPRFRNLDLVQGPPYIRFYAGVPLVSQEGVILGTLCVVDFAPRVLASEDLQLLQALARQVMGQLELRRSQRRFQEQQESLIHQAKLASLGEMAASIAHEINNPLTIINGHVGLLRRILGNLPEAGSTKADQYLEGIEKNVHRTDKIIRGLKALSRDGRNDVFEAVDLAGTIINVNSLMSEKFKNHDIDIRKNVSTKDTWLECRSVQVEQIIINLLSNAFDAIHELSEKWVEIAVFEEGRDLLIRITDSGTGVPEAIQNKIMQPFFTTKQTGQGTGLGLSISKAIAEEHGGSLELDLIAKNTCFVLRLPRNQGGMKKSS